MKKSVLNCVVLGAMLLIGGCLPDPFVNHPPVANVGQNSKISGDSVAVILDGSGSMDPDGDTLTYSWKQTAGATVTLTDANQAKATFTSPSTSGELTFELTVTDSNGVTATATTKIEVTLSPILFVVNSNDDSGAVLGFSNPGILNGNVTPSTDLRGNDKLLINSWGTTVTKNGELVVANYPTFDEEFGSGNAIPIFKDAITATGNVSPVRNIQGDATTLGYFNTETESVNPETEISWGYGWGLAGDISQDCIYVARSQEIFKDLNTNNDPRVKRSIRVFENVSTDSCNGNIPPSREFTSTNDLFCPVGLWLDQADNLYVANWHLTLSLVNPPMDDETKNNILVYSQVRTLSGEVSPSRTILWDDFGTIMNPFVDGDDTLYVISSGVGVGVSKRVVIFKKASTRNGSSFPDMVLTVYGAKDLTSVVVDSNGTGYIADIANDAIYVYDNIATRNGTVLPDRTIQGISTKLNAPNGLFLWQR